MGRTPAACMRGPAHPKNSAPGWRAFRTSTSLEAYRSPEASPAEIKMRTVLQLIASVRRFCIIGTQMRFLLIVLLATPLFCQTDWPVYSGDAGGQRFSPLTQINPRNATKLKLAWQYAVKPSEDQPGRVAVAPATEVTPIMAGGLLYYPTTERSVVALEPETGKEVWKYDLGAAAPRRGLTYWAGDAQNVARIIVGDGNGRMIALNARTGRPIPGF